jgi:hypothetical protein
MGVARSTVMTRGMTKTHCPVCAANAGMSAAAVMASMSPGMSTMTMPTSRGLAGTAPPVRAQGAPLRALEATRKTPRQHRRRQQLRDRGA